MSLDALQDLFSRIRDGATGVWRVGQDPHRAIFLDGGQIVFAQSTHPLDRLTHLLVERGKLTQAQMDYALENLAPGLSIGRNLIQMGFITQRDLLDVARFQVERVVWGALGAEGVNAGFEARELDSSVVRLALDTPALLLGGLLNLRDRERMLELLGPLDQVLELHVQPPEASLPPDLAKVPALFDGRRSLLELAREAGTEPMRLGALALFLKELAWAKAAPNGAPIPAAAAADPASPQVLVVAAPGLLPTQPVVIPPTDAGQDPEPGTRGPSLIEHIQAAQLPTANLDHMAEQLDRMAEPPPPPAAPALRPADPAAPPTQPTQPPLGLRWPPPERDEDEITAENPIPPSLPEAHEDVSVHVEEGQALLPEPQDREAFQSPTAPPLVLEPLDPGPEPFPGLLLPEPDRSDGFHADAPDFTVHPRRGRTGWIVGLLLLGLAGGGAAWWKLRPSPSPEDGGPAAPSPAVAPGKPAPVPTPVEAPVPTPAQAPVQRPVPTPDPVPAPSSKTQPSAPASPEQRWASLKAGRMDQVLPQGQAHVQSLKRSQWTIRLEIACQVDTLRNAAEWLSAWNKDLFVMPIAMKNGQTCNQLFVGSYASKGEAEGQIPRLPKQFREGGNKPRVFQVAEIPSRQ